MNTRETFAIRLKELREGYNLKQSELGEKLDVSRGSISYYENQDRAPDIEFLARASNFFNVSCDYLLGRTRAAAPDDFIQEAVNRYGLSEQALQFIEWLNAPLDIDVAEQDRIKAKQTAFENNPATFTLVRDPNAHNSKLVKLMQEKLIPPLNAKEFQKLLKLMQDETNKQAAPPLTKDEFNTLLKIMQDETNQQALRMLNEMLTTLTGRGRETYGFQILVAIYDYCRREYSDIEQPQFDSTGRTTYTITAETQRRYKLDELKDILAELRNKSENAKQGGNEDA